VSTLGKTLLRLIYECSKGDVPNGELLLKKSCECLQVLRRRNPEDFDQRAHGMETLAVNKPFDAAVRHYQLLLTQKE